MIFTIVAPAAKFWGSMVVLLVIAIAALGNKLTRGITIGYMHYQMNENLKSAIVLVHGAVSLILALALPNNYLNEFEFFKNLYKQEDLWIAGSVLILLFTFLVIIGTAVTLIARFSGLKKVEA
jgi:hypothetical protein